MRGEGYLEEFKRAKEAEAKLIERRARVRQLAQIELLRIELAERKEKRLAAKAAAKIELVEPYDLVEEG